MEFQEVVGHRRMVRSFSPQRVPAGVLERVLANAQRAPSAGFSQGWAFVVLEGHEQTELFWSTVERPEWRARSTRPGKYQAPVVVLALSHPQSYLDRYAEADKALLGRGHESAWPVPYWDVDTGFATLLMLLTATDAGLGAMLVGIWSTEVARMLLDALGVPAGYRAVAAVALGYPAPGDHPSPSLRRGRRSTETVVHRGRWQS